MITSVMLKDMKVSGACDMLEEFIFDSCRLGRHGRLDEFRQLSDEPLSSHIFVIPRHKNQLRLYDGVSYGGSPLFVWIGACAD